MSAGSAVRRGTPTSVRLVFREMTDDDLPDMAGLLGDPAVMRFYPRPKTADEAQEWIAWNRRNHAEHGYGLWIIATRDGEGFSPPRVRPRG